MLEIDTFHWLQNKSIPGSQSNGKEVHGDKLS